MNRAGYSDDMEDVLANGRWRAQVLSATRGKRGQTFLKELLAALDAMPDKRLVAMEFEAEGEFCTLGVIAHQRGVDLSEFDPEDSDVGEQIGASLGIAQQLAREIMYVNDEHVDEHKWVHVEFCGPVRPNWPDYGKHTREVRVPNEKAAEQRWEYMRKWVASQITLSATTRDRP